MAGHRDFSVEIDRKFIVDIVMDIILLSSADSNDSYSNFDSTETTQEDIQREEIEDVELV